jgi:hypothetical protein
METNWLPWWMMREKLSNREDFLIEERTKKFFKAHDLPLQVAATGNWQWLYELPEGRGY